MALTHEPHVRKHIFAMAKGIFKLDGTHLPCIIMRKMTTLSRDIDNQAIVVFLRFGSVTNI